MQYSEPVVIGHFRVPKHRDPMELGNGLFYNQTRSQSRNEINTQTERLVQKHNNLL